MTPGMSPSCTSAPSTRLPSAPMPASSEVLRPRRNRDCVTKRTGRPPERRPDPSAARGRSRPRPRPPAGQCRLDRVDDQRRAVDLGQQLVAARPCGVDRPAASTSAATRVPRCGCGLVCRRPRAAAAGVASPPAARPTPMRHDLGAADRHAGGEPLQHHVEAVELGRLGAARQAEHRLAVELGQSAAGCRDRPACRNG